MSDKLYLMQIDQVPHSSVVGTSLKIVDPKMGMVAMLTILVPQPHLDYRTVADAVAKAILSGHVSEKGVTLVLPDGFGKPPSQTAGK